MNAISFILRAVHFVFTLLEILVIAEVILSYFMSPFHPVRMFVNRIVGPLLAPLRRIIPSVGGMDLSPLALLIILQLLDRLIYSSLG